MSAFDTAAASVLASLMATFGQTVTYTTAAGVATAITGIVSWPHDPSQYVMVEISTAAITPAKRDTVTVDETDYTVFDVIPLPDLGTAKLQLEKQ